MKIKKLPWILDLGCGNGKPPLNTNNHWLSVYGSQYAIGIDISIINIKMAKSLISNGTQFIVCDARNLPFKDSSFGYVHIRGVLHHIDSYQKALLELNRVLKETGTLDLTEVVDDNKIFAIGRRIVGNWRGCKIESFFKSHQLIQILNGNNFIVNNVELRDTLKIIILLSYFGNRSPTVFITINDWYQELINKLDVLKLFCTEIRLLCRKKLS